MAGSNARMAQFIDTTNSVWGNETMVKPEQRDRLHALGDILDDVWKKVGEHQCVTIELLNRALREGNLDITLRGKPERKLGYFAVLDEPEIMNAKGEKSKGMLVLAHIPKGHAPAHRHNDAGTGTGEVTSTFSGTLMNVDPNGEIQTHKRWDSPRISRPGSMDLYFAQPKGTDWTGVYAVPQAPTMLKDLTANQMMELVYSPLSLAMKELMETSG